MFHRLYRLVILSLSTFLILGCAKEVSHLFKKGFVKGTNKEVSEEVYKEKQHEFNYSNIEGGNIKLVYLGCGGYYIEKDGHSILIDPYFSHVGFGKIALSTVFGAKTLQTDTNMVQFGLGECYNPQVKPSSIWVSHAHYDHLMDIPYIFKNYTDRKPATVYCSESGLTNITSVEGIDTSHIVLIDENVTEYNKIGKRYLLYDGSVRVTPIKSKHSPHFLFFEAYKGNAKSNKKYKHELDRTKGGMWRVGMTFSFLIDYLDDEGEVNFRIFIQSTAAAPNNGWLPESIKKEHEQVDLAILGAASFSYVKNYPEPLIEYLDPTYMVITHWEDFFVPYDRSEKKTVRLTNLKKYIRNVNNVYPWKTEGVERFILPKPGTKIKLSDTVK